MKRIKAQPIAAITRVAATRPAAFAKASLKKIVIRPRAEISIGCIAARADAKMTFANTAKAKARMASNVRVERSAASLPHNEAT
jgi:hypothetical protein